MNINVVIAFGSILLFAFIGGIWWWRLGVAEERERQKQGGTPSE